MQFASDGQSVDVAVMPNERTPAQIHADLMRKLKGPDALLAKAVESAHGYRFQDGILYLRYPGPLNNISARILMDSQHKPILDQVATEMGIRVMLE
jgi:hypothetical protein